MTYLTLTLAVIFLTYWHHTTSFAGSLNVEYNVRDVAWKMVTSMFEIDQETWRPHTDLCSWLRQVSKRHRSWCRNDGLKTVLLSAGKLAVKECQEQFRYDQWNCTINLGDVNFLKNGKVFRETALMYAVSAAALTHTVAKSCADGTLKSCNCLGKNKPDFSRPNRSRDNCIDNYDFARHFAERFLQLQEIPYADSLHGSIMQHNIIVGIQAVGQMKTVCKCYGLLEHCTKQKCWNEPITFKESVELLKKSYYQAKLREASNRAFPEKILESNSTLLYMEKTPDLCKTTQGRSCEDPINCNMLCCSRGYIRQTITTTRHCNCNWIGTFKFICEDCSLTENVYLCK